MEWKESGSRFGSSEDKVSLPGLNLPHSVPGFSSVVQVLRDVLVKQSTSHPDGPGEASLNLASGAALERSPLEITSNNGGVKHASTESELVKEAFSDPRFLKQVDWVEAMLRVRARVSADTAAAGASTGTTGLLEGMETKLRDGIKDSLATNKRDLGGMEGVRSALGVRREFGGARTVLETAGEMKGIIGLPDGIESDSSKHLAEITATEFVAVMGATAGESE